MRLLLFLILVAGGVVGYFYWQQTKYPVSAEAPRTEKITRGHIEEKITGSGKIEVRGGLFYIVSETDGKIAKVMPDLTIGKAVKKGDVLIQLDDTLAQSRVQEARSAVSAAQANIERARAKKTASEAQANSVRKDLDFQRTRLEKAEREERSLPAGQLNELRKEYDKYVAAAEAANSLIQAADADITTAVADKARAEAALAVANRGLEQTVIKSPTDGVILDVNKLVRDGQLITRGVQANQQPLLILAENLNDWEVKAQISEQDIGRLQNKMRLGNPLPARFSVEAYSMDKIRFTGKVETIAMLPSPPQRSGFGGLEALQMGAFGGSSSGPSNYTVTINVDPIKDEAVRKNHPLRYGFAATDLQIIVDEYNDVVCVPSIALSFKPEGLAETQHTELAEHEDQGWSAIWLWNNGRYEVRYVKVGASSEDGRTQVREVLGGKPEDLVNQPVVIEAPKRPEKNGLLGGSFKFPG